jgi:hypothetical protein
MIEINGKTSKDAFALRKSGKLDEALTLSRSLYRVDEKDEWIIRAYSWTLISLIWENRTTDAGHKYAEELKRLPALEDEVLSEQRAKALNAADPVAKEIFKVIQLSKDGKHPAALNAALRLRAEQGVHPEIEKTYGWELFHAISGEMYSDHEANKIIIQNHLHEYGKLKAEKPSVLHSRMLDLAARAASKDLFSTFSGFLIWWDLDNLRAEDYNQNKAPNGDVYDSPVEHVIKALGHIAKLEMSDEHVAIASRFINDNYERYPEQKWFPYYLSLYLNRIGEHERALELLIPIAREKSSEFWAWQHLGDCFENDDEKHLACLCRAVLCPVKEDVFLSNVRVSLADAMLTRAQVGHAKHQLEIVKELREKNDWAIKGRLEELLNDSRIIETESETSIDLLKQYAQKADSILMQDLPRFDAVVGSPPFKLGKKQNTYSSVDYLDENDALKSTLVSHKKFELIRDMGIGDPLQIMVDDSREKPMVMGVSIREGDLFDILPTEVGIVSHVNRKKSVSMVKLEDGKKAFLYHNEIENGDRLNEGAFVRCRIAIDRDKVKVRSCADIAYPGDTAYWKSFNGNYRAKSEGAGGHVDSLFIPGHLSDKISDGEFIRGTAVLRSGDGGRNWWCAVMLSETDSGETVLNNPNTQESFTK